MRGLSPAKDTAFPCGL